MPYLLYLFGLADLTPFIRVYIWDPPQAVLFMFALYHIELVTDLVSTLKTGELSIPLAYRKCMQVWLSCLFAAVLLFTATGSAAILPDFFGWLPPTMFFIILAGLVLLIIRRCSRLGYVTPLAAEILEGRILQILNKDKKNDLEGIETGNPVSAEK